MRRLLLPLLAVGVVLPTRALRADDPVSVPPAVAALVARLGSDEYREREDAQRKLDELGAAALPALRDAVRHPDREVSRRAAELLARIELRQESARLLAPQRVRLQYKGAPLADVLADVAKRTGTPFQLKGDQAALGKRRVTLDTGDVPFWEAVTRLCDAAGLAEPDPEITPPPAAEDLFMERRRGGRRVIFLDSASMNHPGDRVEPLMLLDGKRDDRPRAYAGAMRVRLLACNLVPLSGHANLDLEIKPEPRLLWEQLAAVRVQRVLDDQGRTLPNPPAVLPEKRMPELSDDVVIVWDGVREVPFAAAPRRVTLRLPLGGRSPERLRELHGVVAGWIRTAPEPLVTLDLAKQLGQKQNGAGGCTVKVTECNREEDGLFKLKIEVLPPGRPLPSEEIAARLVRINRRGAVAQVSVKPDVAELPFTLTGATGEKLDLVTGTYEADSNAATRVYTVVCKPGKDDGGPAKLVYADRRSAFVEAPFTLRDVPLYGR